MISIIVPIYGVEAFIGDCLQSVAAQTYGGPVECVLVDDCSTDGSMDAVRSFLASYTGSVEFRVLRHERNMGLSEARNTGIRAARGRWLYFLDSDDLLSATALQRLHAVALSHPGVQMVVGNYESFGDGAPELPGIADSGWDSARGSKDVRRRLLDVACAPFSAWNKLVDRRMLTDAGLYFKPRMLCEDVEWSFRMAENIDYVAVCDACTYRYRVRGNSIMTDAAKADARAADIMLSVLRCARRFGPPALAWQTRWALAQLIDLDTELRWRAGDVAPARSRTLRLWAAAVRALRRSSRMLSQPMLWLSLLLLQLEIRSGMTMSSRMFFPVHRASKMFYNLAK
ncbi:MAG: glycosyltransferase family 2 protein [Muribaculaceae bacterium]|nr:glycosyltransferase family 2 protein [Muribaculaceae bacterium]